MPRCFQVHAADNVATLLEDASAGVAEVAGAPGAATVALIEPVALGHKVALRAIPCGHPVIKYGVPIGLATRDIAAGCWVHLHNCRSQMDERSATLEVETGATTDTVYE